MQTEQQEQFNVRLSRWIADQGFWFQLRHSFDSTRTAGGLMYNLFQLSFRVFVFLLILSLGGVYYLIKRTDGDSFRTDLRESISHALGAEELAMRGARRVQGNLEISRLASEGTPATFFEYFEIRNLTCQMSIIDGLVGQWDPGTISIHRLETQLRAGTDSPEDSAKIGEVIFQEFNDVLIRNIDIANASIGWGYSERTRGRIDNTSVQLRRIGNSWRITMRGGEFSQNWLRNLEVREIVAVCTPDGILFEKADLRQGSGTVDFAGLRVSAGDRPDLRGTVKIRGIAFDQILPSAARNFLEGRISGDFTVGGSTNSSDGVSYSGVVHLDGFTRVTIRDRIHLLRALSVVDLYNNYRRLDFTDGSFRLTTQGGSMRISDINLTAGELATMEGEFVARQPNAQELEEMLARGGGSSSDIYDFTDGDEESLLNVDELERQFTLRQAASAAQRAQDGGGGEEEQRLFDRVGVSYEARLFAEQQAARLSRMLIYEGEVTLGLLPNAFERTDTLQNQFPAEPISRRIPVRVPLFGPLHELTLDQAESIYEMGRR